MHMDGARILNAVVASGVPARDFAEPFGTLGLDLSKGLGCPFGAVLAGSRELILEAWTWKQRMGGALRQSGIIAAAGIYALEHHVERMAEDHAKPRLFAESIANLPAVGSHPETAEPHLVLFDIGGNGLPDAEERKRH